MLPTLYVWIVLLSDASWGPIWLDFLFLYPNCVPYFSSTSGLNVIHHFFCDIFQLVVLSCTDTFFVQLMMAILTLIFGKINALVIMTPYVYIVFSIMKITLAKGRSKAFTTCAFHLMAVTLFYTSGVFVYLSSSSGVSSRFNRFTLDFYTVVIPILNPLIYI